MRTVEPGMEFMLEAFIHETETMLAQLDEILLDSERLNSLSGENINDIFRITHTIKGSAAMMEFDGISNLSHAIEDVFYVLRDAPEKLHLVFDSLFDLILATSDRLKSELAQIQQDDEYMTDTPTALIEKLGQLANTIKTNNTDNIASKGEGNAAKQDAIPADELYQILIHFDDDCQMENMRGYMLLTHLQPCCDILDSVPAHPESNGETSAQIIENGFLILCTPIRTIDDVLESIEGELNIKSYELLHIPAAPSDPQTICKVAIQSEDTPPAATTDSISEVALYKNPNVKQSLISVNQRKLDHLIDLVGELVTAESMVIRNPDLKGLKLDNFTKSFRELRKLTSELQDVVMSIRMVPLAGTFSKMGRIVRDMSKKLNKEAHLVTEGGETEVDKTINDAIVDPFMHMIRNAMDHAIESPEERLAMGKSELGCITLTAKNMGGEIHIQVSDDGRGLRPSSLLAKAKQSGLLTKPESEYTDKEAFALILLPGFSTNEQVTEFSGRGVGMDIVRKNIELVGGTISIQSVLGKGTTFTIKIPLTLAIVDGMNLSVGATVFTLPITSITQLFKVQDINQIIIGTDGSEMIMIRGECYPIIRLHEALNIHTDVKTITDGIVIQVESSTSTACIFVDALLGEYQVVVKPFPTFFNQQELKERGLSGCSILGDGSISLILDTNGLLNN